MESYTRNPAEYAAADDENWKVKFVRLELAIRDKKLSGPISFVWDKSSGALSEAVSGLWLYTHDEHGRKTAKLFFSPEQVEEIFIEDPYFLKDMVDMNPRDASYWGNTMDYYSAYDDSDDDIPNMAEISQNTHA